MSKLMAEGERRRRSLMRLQMEVGKVRAAIEAVQRETEALLKLELGQPLGPAERERVRALRLESERLRFELRTLFDEFEQIRSATIPRGKG